jgi:hypothetical protein
MDSMTPYLQLVAIGFGFGITFVHIRNFFIATNVLLGKKPFQCKQPCLLVARGGTRTPDDVVCYFGDGAFTRTDGSLLKLLLITFSDHKI